MGTDGREIEGSLGLFDQLGEGSSNFRDLVQTYVDRQLTELGQFAPAQLITAPDLCCGVPAQFYS